MRVETPLPWKDANNSKWQPLNVAAFFYAKMTAGSIGFPIESVSQWQSDQSVHEDGEILSMVCRFYNSDGATLGWWLFCCIFLSKNSDFRPWKNSDRCLIKKNKFWTSTTPEILIVVLSNGEKITLCVRSPFWKILPALWISSPTHSNLLLNHHPRKLHQNIEQHESSSC